MTGVILRTVSSIAVCLCPAGVEFIVAAYSPSRDAFVLRDLYVLFGVMMGAAVGGVWSCIYLIHPSADSHEEKK